METKENHRTYQKRPVEKEVMFFGEFKDAAV